MNINQKFNQFSDRVVARVDTSHMVQTAEDKMSLWHKDLSHENAERKFDEFENHIREAREQLDQRKPAPRSEGAEIQNQGSSSSENIQQFGSSGNQDLEAGAARDDIQRWRQEVASEDATKPLDQFEDNIREAREKVVRGQIECSSMSLGQMKPTVGSQNMGSRDIRGVGQEPEITGQEVYDTIKHELSDIKDAVVTTMEEAIDYLYTHSKALPQEIQHAITQILHTHEQSTAQQQN